MWASPPTIYIERAERNSKIANFIFLIPKNIFKNYNQGQTGKNPRKNPPLMSYLTQKNYIFLYGQGGFYGIGTVF